MMQRSLPFSFRRTSSRLHVKKAPESPPQPVEGSTSSPPNDNIGNDNSLVVVENAGGRRREGEEEGGRSKEVTVDEIRSGWAVGALRVR